LARGLGSALEDDGNADRVPGYAISKVSLPGKDVAYVLILCTGYSFTDVEHWVEGIFSSREAATAHIAASGWHNWAPGLGRPGRVHGARKLPTQW